MLGPYVLPPRFPHPRFEIACEADVQVPARDGVHLATDLYRPADLPGKLPAILIRTQYDKSMFSAATNESDDRTRYAGVPAAFASQGFVVAVQDLRGLFCSEGHYALARSDGPDGYDTVDWLSKQRWSNGAVGTFGGSSLGITQLFLAQHRHPNHRCAVAQASGGALGSANERHRYWEAWEGGTVKIGWLLKWFDQYGMTDRSAPIDRSAEELRAALWSLPVARMDELLDSAPSEWREWVTRTPDDPAWRGFEFLDDEVVVDLPTLFVNTWHDTCPGDTIHEFELFRRRAACELIRESQFLIVGPGLHTEAEYLDDRAQVGELSYPRVAEMDYWGLYVSWFEHWLRGKGDAPPRLPRVQYYLMGRNCWQNAAEWPAPGAHPTRLYLRGERPANTRLGAGRLNRQPPQADEPADRIAYDPGEPTPAVGGAHLEGPADQSAVELRDDVLCYTSDRLKDDLEAVGHVKAVLFVSSDAPDTDFTAKLVDVWPDGRAFDLCRGIIRTRYHKGFDQQVFLRAGEIARVEIDMQATAHVWLAGHRIRLEVSSSEFPTYDRNLNTGESNELSSRWQIARNAVHHAPAHASYIELPLIERTAGDRTADA
jgi:putative CocE/NonD family hydrolase